MTDIELKRKELDRLIVAKGFKLSDSDVVQKALEFEKSIKNMGSH